jgi:large subunit ribosomal protein L9
VEALKAQGYTVERRRIALKEPIKEVGDYDVVIKLHREIKPVVKVLVRKEGTVEVAAATEEAPVADSTPPEVPTTEETTATETLEAADSEEA